MTEEITEETTTEEVTEEVTETPPFLRINHTWPNAAGRIESFTLELNLGEEIPVGEAEVTDGDVLAARSWVLDLIGTTIRELRGAGRKQPLIVIGAAHAIVGGKVHHGAACAGACGITPTLSEKWFYAEPAPASTPGSAGADRKDQP